MAMTLRLSDEQTAALRERAEREHRSMQQIVLNAIDEYLVRTSRAEQIKTVSGKYADRYSDLLQRLGE
jgi:predicted transcriptional regulator